MLRFPMWAKALRMIFGLLMAPVWLPLVLLVALGRIAEDMENWLDRTVMYRADTLFFKTGRNG